MTSLERFLYVSRAADGLRPEDVDELVRQAQQRNAELQLTGALRYTGTHFTQVLEGPVPALDAVLASLLRDPRHSELRMLYRAAVPARRFEGWALAYAETLGEADLVDELHDEATLDAARAERLLGLLFGATP